MIEEDAGNGERCMPLNLPPKHCITSWKFTLAVQENKHLPALSHSNMRPLHFNIHLLLMIDRWVCGPSRLVENEHYSFYAPHLRLRNGKSAFMGSEMSYWLELLVFYLFMYFFLFVFAWAQVLFSWEQASNHPTFSITFLSSLFAVYWLFRATLPLYFSLYSSSRFPLFQYP